MFTLSLSYITSRIALEFPPMFILTFLVLNLAITTILNLYLITSDKEVTLKSGLVSTIVGILFGGFLMLVFYDAGFAEYFVCIFGALIVGGYLTISAKLIYEEKRKSLSTDDDIAGLVSIYTDVVMVVKHFILK